MVAASATSLCRFLPEVRIVLLLMAGLAVQAPSELSALVNETRTPAIDIAADQIGGRRPGAGDIVFRYPLAR